MGQRNIVHQVLVCLLAGGNALLEGVPGLGKTVLVRTLADAIDCQFSRIQFTPDLMPADIIGTNILVEDEAAVAGFSSSKARSLPTCFLRTRSTVQHQRPNRRCWRRCKKEQCR